MTHHLKFFFLPRRFSRKNTFGLKKKKKPTPHQKHSTISYQEEKVLVIRSRPSFSFLFHKGVSTAPPPKELEEGEEEDHFRALKKARRRGGGRGEAFKEEKTRSLSPPFTPLMCRPLSLLLPPFFSPLCRDALVTQLQKKKKIPTLWKRVWLLLLHHEIENWNGTAFWSTLYCGGTVFRGTWLQIMTLFGAVNYSGAISDRISWKKKEAVT